MSSPFAPDWVAFSADITPEAAHVFQIAVQNPNRPPEVPADIDSYEAVAFTSRPVVGSPIDNEYAFFCNNMPAGEVGMYTAALVYVHQIPIETHITKFIEVHPPKHLD